MQTEEKVTVVRPKTVVTLAPEDDSGEPPGDSHQGDYSRETTDLPNTGQTTHADFSREQSSVGFSRESTKLRFNDDDDDHLPLVHGSPKRRKTAPMTILRRNTLAPTHSTGNPGYSKAKLSNYLPKVRDLQEQEQEVS